VRDVAHVLAHHVRRAQPDEDLEADETNEDSVDFADDGDEVELQQRRRISASTPTSGTDLASIETRASCIRRQNTRTNGGRNIISPRICSGPIN
jgi:hypothetical protein